MLGFIKCGACGKRFRSKNSSLVCPQCKPGIPGPVNDFIYGSLKTTITGTSELDNAKRKIQQAQLEEVAKAAEKITDMQEKIDKWKQLNGILYDPKGLSASEIAKYKRMRKELEKSDAVRAYKRPPTRADRKRQEAIDSK